MTEDVEFTRPFSIRLTVEERRQLDADAGPLSLGEYIRTQLFHQQTPRKRNFRRRVQDEQALTKVLGALGRSRLSSNLNQIARAVHTGSLQVSPETEQAIIEACARVAAMSGELVKALGLPEEEVDRASHEVDS